MISLSSYGQNVQPVMEYRDLDVGFYREQEETNQRINNFLEEQQRKLQKQLDGINRWAEGIGRPKKQQNTQNRRNGNKVNVQISGGISFDNSPDPRYTPSRQSGSSRSNKNTRNYNYQNSPEHRQWLDRRNRQIEENRQRARERDRQRQEEENRRREIKYRTVRAVTYAAQEDHYRDLSDAAHYRTHEGADILNQMHNSRNLMHVSEGNNFDTSSGYVPHKSFRHSLRKKDDDTPTNADISSLNIPPHKILLMSPTAMPDDGVEVDATPPVATQTNQPTKSGNVLSNFWDSYVDATSCMMSDLYHFAYNRSIEPIKDYWNRNEMSERIIGFFSSIDTDNIWESITDNAKEKFGEKAKGIGKNLLTPRYKESVERIEDILRVDLNIIRDFPSAINNAVKYEDLSYVDIFQKNTQKEVTKLARKTAGIKDPIENITTSPKKAWEMVKGDFISNYKKRIKGKIKVRVTKLLRNAIPDDLLRHNDNLKQIFK